MNGGVPIRPLRSYRTYRTQQCPLFRSHPSPSRTPIVMSSWALVQTSLSNVLRLDELLQGTGSLFTATPLTAPGSTP